MEKMPICSFQRMNLCCQEEEEQQDEEEQQKPQSTPDSRLIIGRRVRENSWRAF